MTHDPLDEATRALRERPVDHDRAAETKARLLAAARRPAPKPRRRPVWVLPLVAALVATGALAATATWLGAPPEVPVPPPSAPPSASWPTSTRAPAAPTVARSADAPREVGSNEPPPVLGAAEPPASGAPPAPTVASASAGPPASRPSTAVSAPAPTATTTTTTVEGAAPPVPTTTATAPDPADELYRDAHEKHFRGGDASAAVAAWDRYLAAAPDGRFSVEARFNRALALLRAGRRDEGLAALKPFAEGRFGGYRRDEAKRLLEAAAPK